MESQCLRIGLGLLNGDADSDSAQHRTGVLNRNGLLGHTKQDYLGLFKEKA
jgi:hypothetical protein